MKVNFNKRPRMDFVKFAEQYGLELVINERSAEYTAYTGKRYYVSFKGAEILDDGFLISASGNGNTIREAIENYAKRISEKKLVFNAYWGNRQEILVPELSYNGGVSV